MLGSLLADGCGSAVRLTVEIISVLALAMCALLVAYTAGMASSGLSLVPGGIGVVEAALILVLVAGEIPAAAALPAVLLYR